MTRSTVDRRLMPLFTTLIIAALACDSAMAQLVPPKKEVVRAELPSVEDDDDEEDEFVTVEYPAGMFARFPQSAQLPAIGRAGFGGMPTATIDGAAWQRAMDVIVEVVEPDSWEDNGGEGRITLFGDRIVVTQTRAIHARVDHLLKILEMDRPMRYAVEARWLFMTAEEYAGLIADSLVGGATDGAAYNAERLAELVRTVPGVHTEFFVHDGSTNAVMLGERKLTGRRAELVALGEMLGYEVETLFRNDGTALQVTAVAVNDDTVALDVHSFVCIPSGTQPAETVKYASAGEDVTIRIPALTRSVTETSLQVPLGRRVIVSALTFNPRLIEGDQRVLCLVLGVRKAP